MGRQENVFIFEDTREHCKKHPVIANAIRLSNDHQEVFLENDPVLPAPKVGTDKAKIVVWV